MKSRTILFFLVSIFLSVSQYALAQETYKVTTQKLNVRSIPFATGKVLGTLSKGQAVEVMSIEEGWALVNYKNKQGYISASYIEKVDKQDVGIIQSDDDASNNKDKDTDYSSYTTKRVTSSEVTNGSTLNASDYADVTAGYFVAKYDYLKPAEAEKGFNGISIGYLSNPLDCDGKKSSWTMQLGAFVDYYWMAESNDYIKSEMHYLGLTIPMHLLGWQFSNGKGNGFSVHGGFEFTWRIAGGGSTKIKGYDENDFNPFDKDDMGEGRLKHFAVGFGAAADYSCSNFYASVGYKFLTPIMPNTNISGPYFVLGFNF